MRRKLGKKGVEAYVSWILLTAFAVAISVFMYSWINSQVETSVDNIEQRSDLSMCDDIGLNIKNMCQNTQTLNTNITNVKLLAVSQLNFRFFDLYDNVDQRQVNITIRPGDTQFIEVIKQGTLKQVEIIPVIKQDNKIITCTKSMLSAENIKIC